MSSRALRELGDKPAFIDAPSGRTISYVQLVESVRAAAAGLAARGFGKGEVFAHYAPNLPEYAVAFHAVATVGGVNTTANPLLTVEELAAQLKDSGARLLVTVPELLEKATAAAERAGVEEIFVYGEAAGATPFASLLAGGWRAARGSDRPGQRSRRAAVFERHDGAAEGRDADAPKPGREHLPGHVRAPAGGVEPMIACIAVLPFFHIYGLVWLMNLPLYCGATVVTMPRFDLREFLRVIQDYRITLALCRSADRARVGQASAGRRVRPLEPGVRGLAARRRCRPSSRWRAASGWAAGSRRATA